MHADEHLGFILAGFPFSSASLVMTVEAKPNLQKSFNSTHVGTSTTGTPCILANAMTVFL